MLLSQAALNHRRHPVRVARSIDFSGWWILAVAVILTAVVLWHAPALDWSRLVTFTNYSGQPADNEVWPRSESLVWLFALGFLLPAYTLTGFDAVRPCRRGDCRSRRRGAAGDRPGRGRFGRCSAGSCSSAVVLAVPDLDAIAGQGNDAFAAAIKSVLPGGLATVLFVGIGVAQ